MKKLSRALVAIAAAGALAVSGTSVAGAETADDGSSPFEALAELSSEDDLSSELDVNSSDDPLSESSLSDGEDGLSSSESDEGEGEDSDNVLPILIGILVVLGIGAALFSFAPQLGIDLPQLPF